MKTVSINDKIVPWGLTYEEEEPGTFRNVGVYVNGEYLNRGTWNDAYLAMVRPRAGFVHGISTMSKDDLTFHLDSPPYRPDQMNEDWCRDRKMLSWSGPGLTWDEFKEWLFRHDAMIALLREDIKNEDYNDAIKTVRSMTGLTFEAKGHRTSLINVLDDACYDAATKADCLGVLDDLARALGVEIESR